MSGWNLEASGGSSSQDKTAFTKFSEGVTKIRVLSNAPHQRFSHWMPQFQRSATCPGRGCPICEMRKKQKMNGLPETYQNRRMFSFNIFNYGTNKVEVMEQGIKFVESLRDVMEDLREDGKDLKDVVLKIRRRGMGNDNTTYRIDVDEERAMNDEEMKQYMSQIDLDEYFAPQTPEQIIKLLAVNDNFKDAWIDIVVKKEDTEPVTAEDFETE